MEAFTGLVAVVILAAVVWAVCWFARLVLATILIGLREGEQKQQARQMTSSRAERGSSVRDEDDGGQRTGREERWTEH